MNKGNLTDHASVDLTRSTSVWRRPALQWLTMQKLLTIIVFVAIFAMAVRTLADTDVWWHLQSGRWMVENRKIARTDPFSHTVYGKPWIDHGWLAQMILYLLYASLGYAGPVLFVAAIVTLAFAFVWLQMQREDPWLRAFVIVIAAITSAGIWAARPQIISFALASLVAYLLYLYKQGRRRAIWFLPVIVVAWVNIHGGYAIAFILIAAYLFGEVVNQILRIEGGLAWRDIGKLVVVAAVCFLVVPLNPNGIKLWAYPFQTVGIGILQDYIVEWRSPNFHELYLHPFIWMLLATVTALGLSGTVADFTDLTLVALFGYMSLLAARNIPLFALVSAPVIAGYGSVALVKWRQRFFGEEEAKKERQIGPMRPLYVVLNWSILILILFATVIRISQPISAAANEEAQARDLPVEAIGYIRANRPDGPIFNSYNWGGYLIWSLPEYPVYVDGRTDLYGDDFLRDYLMVIAARDGWQDVLDRYNVKLALIEPKTALADRLGQNTGWTELYRDEKAVVFARGHVRDSS